jgi:hypothetical protein
MAGNRATAQMLSRRAAGDTDVSITVGPSSGCAPRRLHRFAVAVTTLTAHGGVLLIDRVQIGARPPGLFGSQHKSHTVGWETFCDGLRFEIMRKTPAQALARIQALYQQTLVLPVMARADKLPQASAAPSPAQGQPPNTPARRLQAALDRAQAADAAAAPIVASPLAFSADQQIGVLQEFAAAYLQLRNTVPLAEVNLEHPSGGEDLRPIREHESGARDVDSERLRSAMWRQLDVRALARIATDSVTADKAPGIDATPAQASLVTERRARVHDLLRTHLTSMLASYPRCFAHAALGDPGSVRDFLKSIAGGAMANQADRIAFPADWIEPLVAAITGSAVPALAPGAPRAQGLVLADPDKRIAVQLVTGLQGGRPTVTELHDGGRPRGVFGARHGSHTTAWSLLVDTVRAQVVNRTPAEAWSALVEFGDPLRNALGETAARQAAMPLGPDQELLSAQEAYDAAVVGGHGTPDIVRTQRLAAAVLHLLNTQPLSAVDKGGLNNPAREGDHRAAARHANVAGGPPLTQAQQAALRHHLWGLLDDQAVLILLDEKSDEDEVPGTLSGESGGARAGAAIRRHLAFVAQAYPHAYARAGLAGENSLLAFISPFALRRNVAFDIVTTVFAQAAPGPLFNMHYPQALPGFKRGTKRGRVTAPFGEGKAGKRENEEWRGGD